MPARFAPNGFAVLTLPLFAQARLNRIIAFRSTYDGARGERDLLQRSNSHATRGWDFAASPTNS